MVDIVGQLMVDVVLLTVVVQLMFVVLAVAAGQSAVGTVDH